MAPSTHRCFSRDTLVDLQLGKLSQDRITQVYAESSDCPVCCQLLATLDNVSDPMLAALHGLDDGAAARMEAGGRSSADSPREVLPVRSRPRRLGQYLLETQIGKGGMGTVWRAFHDNLKRHVAIKLMKLESLPSRELVARFFREMEAIGRLVHPNLVQAFDAGEVDGQPYLAMELLEGMDLSEVVQRSGPLSVSEACEVVRQAALGMAHAHAAQCVHRDIKPSNLFLTTDGVVKILDLGLARLVDAPSPEGQTTQDYQLLGTPAYMSPEQILKPRLASRQSDIYSLGCTFYFLLSGMSPFQDHLADGPLGVALAQSSQSPPDLEQRGITLPAPVSRLIQRMMAKQPEDRPADMQEIANVLGEFCRDGKSKLLRRNGQGGSAEPLETASECPDESGRAWKRSGSIRMVGWAALIVISISGVYWQAFSGGETNLDRGQAVVGSEGAGGESVAAGEVIPGSGSSEPSESNAPPPKDDRAHLRELLQGIMTRYLKARLINPAGKPSDGLEPIVETLPDGRLSCTCFVEISFDTAGFYKEAVPPLDRVLTRLSIARGGPLTSDCDLAYISPYGYYNTVQRTGEPVYGDRTWHGSEPPAYQGALPHVNFLLSRHMSEKGGTEQFQWYQLEGDDLLKLLADLQHWNVRLNIDLMSADDTVIWNEAIDPWSKNLLMNPQDKKLWEFTFGPYFLTPFFSGNPQRSHVILSPAFGNMTSSYKRVEYYPAKKSIPDSDNGHARTILNSFTIKISEQQLRQITKARTRFVDTNSASP